MLELAMALVTTIGLRFLQVCGQSQLNYDVHSTSSTPAPIIGEPKMAKSINLALTPIKNIVLAKKTKKKYFVNFFSGAFL